MNYTISEIRYTDVPTGTQVSTVHPTGTLTLTPNPGYTLTAIDFEWQSTNPYINAVVFTQSGPNLIATIGFEPTFIMPGNNIEIPLCFSRGDGVLINYIVSGSVQPIVGANITSLPGSNTVIPFSTSGNLNAALTVFTGTLTCATGYYMPVTPVIVQTAGDPTNFLVAYNDTFAGGLLTARQYTINYTVPNYDSINNVFSISAEAAEIYVPTIKITNYLTSNSLLSAGGDLRPITIVGNSGASWTLTCADSIIMQSDNITTGLTLSGVLDSTGTFVANIIVPPVTVNTTYTVVISGDLIIPFPSPTNIIFNQYVDVDITYTTTPNTYFTNSGNVIVTGAPQSFGSPGMSGYDTAIDWSITPVFGMILVRQPVLGEWTNLDILTNGGSSISIESISATQTSSTLIKVNSLNRVVQYGLTDLTSALQLGNFIAYIKTNITTAITNTTATSGSIVDYSGTGGIIGERGICYSTSALPTIANTKIIQSSGFGNKTSDMIGLTPGTTYFVRAYCFGTDTNVYYGNQETFKTLGTSISLCYDLSSRTLACDCTPGCLDCIPGTETTIDSQTWTVCNLGVTTYADGTPIPEVSDSEVWADLTTGAWCYYNNITANGTTYGKLYNWYAVAGIWDEASKTDPLLRKSLSPSGYYTPIDEDWIVLTDYLGGDTVAGGKMKEVGLCHWASPNTGATNESNFTALAGGYRDGAGNFSSNGIDGYWWNQSSLNANSGRYYYMTSTTAAALPNSTDKRAGMSVRIIYAP